MTATRGQIVWVEITDPQGGNLKCRPAVILTTPAAAEPETELWVVGITTQLSSVASDNLVELPWARNRHPKTGLKERCGAVCTWLKLVKLGDIQSQAGIVPGKQLLEILGKIGPLPD